MVSKTKFLAACAANQKSKIFKFFQLFFKNKKDNTIYKIYVASLSVLFAVMLFYGISEPNLGYFPEWPLILQIAAVLFIVLLVPIVLGSYIFGLLDQKRIEKICKLLDISLFEYDELCKKYSKDLK